MAEDQRVPVSEGVADMIESMATALKLDCRALTMVAEAAIRMRHNGRGTIVLREFIQALDSLADSSSRLLDILSKIE